MGAYFIVVNPAKKQYLDPNRFGEGNKFTSVLRGEFCLRALKLLISDCFRRDKQNFCGAWLGDPVLLASDDSGLPNPNGLVTATTSDLARNLNAQARAEFTDISYRALAELCLDPETAAELAAQAKQDQSLLIDLVGVIEQYDMPSLAFSLELAVGRPWRKTYNKARADSHWQPLPPIDWPLLVPK